MIKLRPYKGTDAGKIVAWVNGEADYCCWSAAEFGDFPLTSDQMNSVIDNSDGEHFYLTAFDETGVTGFLSVHFCDEQAQCVSFRSLIVCPQYRGQGYGKKLLMLAMHYAYEILQTQKIRVQIFECNDVARYCFRQAGFSEVDGERPEDYIFSGERWASQYMEHSVNAPKTPRTQMTSTDANYPEERIVEEIIDNNSFSYAFQPIVSAATGEIFAYEALMRANYGGPVSPSVILKYATKNHRLYDIEKLTFFNVFKQVEKEKEAFGNRRVFVNSIPGYLLTDEDYSKLIEGRADLLKQITIEITEETDINDMELEVLLQRSNRDGCKIAIDDYGTGYSNTSSLLRCVPNCIKMDRLLISNIQEEPKKQHFVKSIIEFAHDNGIMALAEGVETAAELRTVIEMGVDLIQGFFTAKPSFSILQEIDDDIRNQILNVNVHGKNNENRRVYMVEDETELPLMRLALEKYTGIIVSGGELTLVGNVNYMASMSVKIKDNSDCCLKIRNVSMESINDLPCIELGRNCHVTLLLDGVNKLRKIGICVPESSSLKIDGKGSLNIRVQGRQSYCIGNDWDSAAGSIEIGHGVSLNCYVEADKGIGIGGGLYKDGNEIRFGGGHVTIEAASKEAIGVGCVCGEVPIEIRECALEIMLRTDCGIGIGSLTGDQNVMVFASKVEVQGSGNDLCGIGTGHSSKGTFTFEQCGVHVEMNGQKLVLIGNGGGGPDINIHSSGISLRGEGKDVVGMGSFDRSAKIAGLNSDVDIMIRSSVPLAVGAQEENISFTGGRQHFHEND